MALLRTFLCLSVLTLVGCASMGQPKRPDTPGMAILELPIALDLVSVNGQAFSGTKARGNPYFHTLAPGNYALEVGYTEYWGTPLAGELVRSDIYRIDLTLQADTVYQLQHADPGTKQIINESRFKERFAVWAMEQGSGLRSDGTFSRKFSGLLDLLTGAAGASSEPSVSGQPTTDVAVAVPDSPQPESTEALGQLKMWWQRASKTERGEFLLWSTNSN